MPQVYLSMQGTPSDQRIENDNPLADPNTYENPAGTDRAVIPRRRVQPKVEHTPKETQPKRNAQAKDTTGHNKDKARTPPPSFTD